jgi:CRP-like cAMP-binding protein
MNPELLTKHPLFEDLPAPDIDLIATHTSELRFPAGAYLFREGEPAAQFFIIERGKVALEIHAPERGPLTIQTIEPGDVAGWSWLMPPYRWHLTGRAVAQTHTVAIDGSWLRVHCEQNPALGYPLMKRFSQIVMERLQATQLQLLNLYSVNR